VCVFFFHLPLQDGIKKTMKKKKKKSTLALSNMLDIQLGLAGIATMAHNQQGSCCCETTNDHILVLNRLVMDHLKTGAKIKEQVEKILPAKLPASVIWKPKKVAVVGSKPEEK